MLSGGEFVASYGDIARRKVGMSLGRLLLLSILAGVFIALGGAVTATVAHGVDDVGIARLLAGLLFPLGLIMVVFTGAELFTGNCLLAVAVLGGRASWRGAARNLAVVYLGNALGAAALAAAWVYSGQPGLSDGALGAYVIRTAAAKCALPFGRALVLGALCNLLVCTAGMCALCAKDAAGRAIGAFVPVVCFVICGFEHCVANLFYVPAGLLALGQWGPVAGANLAQLGWGQFLWGNLLPVTLGNLLGGLAFGALIWLGHRQGHQ